MAGQLISVLKGYFERRKKPTQEQFAELVDTIHEHTQSIVPATNEAFNVGAAARRYNEIYGKTIFADNLELGGEEILAANPQSMMAVATSTQAFSPGEQYALDFDAGVVVQQGEDIHPEEGDSSVIVIDVAGTYEIHWRMCVRKLASTMQFFTWLEKYIVQAEAYDGILYTTVYNELSNNFTEVVGRVIVELEEGDKIRVAARTDQDAMTYTTVVGNSPAVPCASIIIAKL